MPFDSVELSDAAQRERVNPLPFVFREIYLTFRVVRCFQGVAVKRSACVPAPHAIVVVGGAPATIDGAAERSSP